MFTEKEMNTLIGLFFSASNVPPTTNPDEYHQNFTNALEQYFKCFPNDDVSDDIYSAGDSPVDE